MNEKLTNCKLRNLELLPFSKYNFKFSHNDKYYLYNCETNFFCEISQELMHAIETNSINNIPTNIIEKFKQVKVLIYADQTDDYFYKELYKFNFSNYNPSTLYLVIAPTTECNFRCPYCFEPHNNSTTMSEETIDSLINFIKKRKDSKYLNISWYGGEPLVAIKAIKTFHNKIKDLDIQILSQTIITNGYLLTDNICKTLSKLKINSLQITLDGLKESNDKTRVLVNGQGSYEVIYSNIRNIINNYPDLRIAIRVNIDKNKINNFIDVYNQITSDFHDNDRIQVYPGLLKIDSTDKKKLCTECFSTEELYPLHNQLKDLNFDLIRPLERKNKGCIMHMSHGFVVGPKGELYKCWSDVGKPYKIIGNIQSDVTENTSLLLKYTLQSIPFNDECKNCMVFPICSGGCSLDRYRNKFENSNFSVCSPLKNPQNLKHALISTFLSK